MTKKQSEGRNLVLGGVKINWEEAENETKDLSPGIHMPADTKGWTVF